MNIYKERNKRNIRYERNRNETLKKDTTADNKADYVEYTNMSSYERYLRNKENSYNAKNQYNETENKHSYYGGYGYDNRDNGYYNDGYGYREDGYRNLGYRNDGYREEQRYRSDDRRYYDDYRDNSRNNRDNSFYDYSRRYDEQYETRDNYSTNRTSKKKKKALSLKAKFMIGIYVLIVVAIVALVVYNALPGVKADKSEQVPESVLIEQSALDKVDNGDALNKVDSVIDDSEDSDSNWFDKLLDTLG